MVSETFLDGKVILHGGDCLDVLDTLPENSIDACVCDPPYHLTSIVERFGKEGAAAMFAVGEGRTGLVASPAGDSQILFKIAEVFEPAGADASSVPEDAQKSFAAVLSDDLLDELVAQLQAQYSVSIDQTAMQQALN